MKGGNEEGRKKEEGEGGKEESNKKDRDMKKVKGRKGKGGR